MSDGPKETDNPGDQEETLLRRRHIRILGRHIPVPQSVAMRRTLGGGLVAGGILGFLPVLGFWMVPLGLVVLSQDSAVVRRKRRQLEVKILRRWRAGKSPADKDQN